MDFEPIKSANLVEAGYKPEEQKCTVRFKGGSLYEYENVTPELWAQFSATFDTDESSGSFFHQHMKSLPYRKA